MIRARSQAARLLIAALWLAMVVALVALGTWQVQRRVWKLDLIARVDAGLRAPPVPAPATAGLGSAYRRIATAGTFLAGRDSLVQASTVLGPGWWVMTPLRSDSGRVILVNRGYVPDRHVVAVPAGHVTVTGLLRLSEPGGGFLRANDPAAERWYSRDVSAIAARRGVAMAPYFIDRDASANAPGQPVGGLTVVHFPNNHLVYAITWYTLAIMALAGFIYWITLDRHPVRDAA